MKTILTFLFSITISVLFGQMDTIYFTNPSFEDDRFESARFRGNMPKGWFDCGFNGESPPDMFTSKNNSFQVLKKPVNGESFLGLVARDNRTWERISQKLSKPLKKGNCYSLSVDLARAENYKSHSRLTGNPVNYNKPIILRIFGGTQSCRKEELLAVSPLIQSTDWLGYHFMVNPKDDYPYIFLEAFYQTPIEYPYNGNILIDNLSVIHQISCESNDINVSAEELNAQLQEHLMYVDKDEFTPENQTEKIINGKREQNRFASTKNYEADRLSNDRNKAALNLLKEKVEKLAETGLFHENEKKTDIEGTDILNQIIKLLKTNPNLGLDIAIKKQGSRKVVMWRLNYLFDTFLANNIRRSSFDIDKISKFQSTSWPFENDLIAISAYLKN